MTASVINKAGEGERVYLPFNKLVFSPKNVREQESGDPELAASIMAFGVLENLIVYPMTKKGKLTGMYAVPAGGRRMAALALLLEPGKIAEDYPVPVLIADEAQAEGMSLAENVHRKELTPAQQFVGFKKLVDAGSSIEEVAAKFGVDPLLVKRRLKLANVAPRLFELFAKGEIKLDQMMALALTDDHAAQERVWDLLPAHSRHASNIRRHLTENEVDSSSDRFARFVGRAEYEAAGGPVRSDMFSDAVYLQDVELLTKLATEKLEAAAAPVLNEDFAWVDVRLSIDYSELHSFIRAPRVQREASEAEQAQINALQAQIDVLENELGELEVAGEEDSEAFEQKSEQLGALQDTLEEFGATLCAIDEPFQAVNGAVVHVNQIGEVAIVRNIIRPDDYKAVSKQQKEAAAANPGATGAGAQAETKTHSERLTRQLSAHRSAALQASIAIRPDVALPVLLMQLVKKTFQSFRFYQQTTVHISIDAPDLIKDAEDLPQSRAGKEMAQLREEWAGRIGELEDAQLFAWLQQQPQTVLLELLAFCTACAFGNVQSNDKRVPMLDAVAEAVNLDMADWWQPTADSYFAAVPKTRILTALTEAVSAEVATSVAGMKKAELVKSAENHMRSSRWLPELMRQK